MGDFRAVEVQHCSPSMRFGQLLVKTAHGITENETSASSGGRRVLDDDRLFDADGDGDGDGDGNGDDNVKGDLLLLDGIIISLLSPHIVDDSNNQVVDDTDLHRHHGSILLKRR